MSMNIKNLALALSLLMAAVPCAFAQGAPTQTLLPAESISPASTPEMPTQTGSAPAADVMPAPDQASLDTPPASPPAPPELTPLTPAKPVETVNAVPPLSPAEENLFFDSQSLAPKGEMRSSAPTKVSPVTEPGSSLIIVTKQAGGETRDARLVGASRAITLGRYDSALRIYDDLYQKNPNDPSVLIGRAVALQKLGQKEDSIQAYEAFLQIRPNDLPAQINMLGLMGERYPAVALQRLKDLEKKHTNHPGLLTQIGLAEANLGHYDEALRALGIASSLDGNNASILFNLAVVADRAGKKSDAVSYYEQALEVDTVYGGGRTIPREAVFERLANLR